MKTITYLPTLTVNRQDLGIEVDAGVLYAPVSLRPVLESMGVSTPDLLAATLQSFPTAIGAQLGFDAQTLREASAGALVKLRVIVDPTVLEKDAAPQRRGMGALPPGWLRRNGG